MAFWRILYSGASRYILILAVYLPVVSCSGGDGGPAGGFAGGTGTGTGTGTLNWAAPMEREDGSPLVLSDIGGYRVYYGVQPGIYQGVISINDPTATASQLAGVPQGIYFIVMTVVDSAGRESVFSPEVRITV